MEFLRMSAVVLVIIALATIIDSTKADATDGTAPIGAVEQAERFLDLVVAKKPEQAVNFLFENHPRQDLWDQQKTILVGHFKAVVMNTPIQSYQIVGHQEFGSALLRLNYALNADWTAYGIALVLMHRRNNLLVEHICLAEDMAHATQAGEGVIQCD